MRAAQKDDQYASYVYEACRDAFRHLFGTRASISYQSEASKATLISFFETLRVEVGSEIGITFVTPGVIQSSITNDEWLAEANMKWVPMASTEGCARAIVDSISHGDEYLTEPPWMRVLFLVNIVCPNKLKWITHFLIIPLSNNHHPFTSKSY